MRERKLSVKDVKKRMKGNPSLVGRNYVVVEFRFSDFSDDDKEKIKQDAEELSEKANKKGANSGEKRTDKVVENDAYAGKRKIS